MDSTYLYIDAHILYYFLDFSKYNFIMSYVDLIFMSGVLIIVFELY